MFTEFIQMLTNKTSTKDCGIKNNIEFDFITLLLDIIKSSDDFFPKSRQIYTTQKNVPYKKSPLSLDPNQMPNIKADHQAKQIKATDDEGEIDEEVGKFRKYKKNNEIAQQCQKLLRITAYPTVAQLTQLVDQIAQSSAVNNMKISEIRSAVLHWFRKRREYMASKVYSVCDDVMTDAWMGTINSALEADQVSPNYEKTVEMILSDGILIDTIVLKSKIPVKNHQSARNFVQRKVRDYFTKLCSKIDMDQ